MFKREDNPGTGMCENLKVLRAKIHVRDSPICVNVKREDTPSTGMCENLKISRTKILISDCPLWLFNLGNGFLSHFDRSTEVHHSL